MANPINPAIVYQSSDGQNYIEMGQPNGERITVVLTESMANALGINPASNESGTEENINIINDVDESAHEASIAEEVEADPVYNKKKWTDSEVKFLLSEYKNQKKLFQGSAIKNDQVWKGIATSMHTIGTHINGQQCKFKFQALKKQYTKVKDNNNKSGAATMSFKFMEEFEELFANDPIYTPVALAESLRPIIVPESNDSYNEILFDESADSSRNTSMPSSSKKSKRTPIGERP